MKSTLKAIISVGGKKHPVEFEKVIEPHVLIQKYVKRDWDFEYNDGDSVARIVTSRGTDIIIRTVKLLDG